MTPRNDIPKGKFARALVGGRTAARVGGAYIKHAATRPFLSGREREQAKHTFSDTSAAMLFDGLCQLKGTALKMAQLLSLELDVFPPEIRAHLERSYNEVPPMNRALARKALINAYGAPPEKVFNSFQGTAFAAASLGQVHRAESIEGAPLALKIQYPGIRRTIHSDVVLLKGALRPFPEYKAMLPILREIEERFVEETDYRLEADNAAFFGKHLGMESIRVPEVFDDLSTEHVLCLSLLDGTPLNAWLRTSPPPYARNQVAQILEDMFIRCLYELRCIHADPNPGNFLVLPDNTVGLVDFGCVKHFDTRFVDLYRQLPLAFYKQDSDACIQALRDLGTIPPDTPPELEEKMRTVALQYSRWLRRLFEPEVFDFGKEKDFITQGKTISAALRGIWRDLRVNPDFVFLDRTRYGLLRLFERMEARVSFRSTFEWAE